ncbi:MAG: hypothetical protein H6978_08140 [Gammaproteobacteria bacterium]|nr:hypothetical protein [Gammaproteobacteria bacterium]
MPIAALPVGGRGLALICVAAFAVLAAGCAGTPKGDGANTSNMVASADNNQECRTVARTGSNLPRKICRSKEMWEAIDNIERRNAEDYTQQIRSNAASMDQDSRESPYE